MSEDEITGNYDSLDGVRAMQEFELCYAEMPWAWFTDGDFDDILADDWHKPLRQALIYGVEGGSLLKVAIDGPVENENQSASPMEINARGMAWLTTSLEADRQVYINAGLPLDGFVESIEQAGGGVYIPMSDQGMFDTTLTEDQSMTDDEPEPDENLAAFQRDLALRQAKIAQSYLQVIRMALNENRPLEALTQTNNAIEEMDEELESLEEMIEDEVLE